MVSTLKKVWRIYQRDGFYFTFKRTIAFLISHTPLAYRLSFPYTTNTRLVFAPALLTYSIFADKQTRHTDIDLIKKYTPTGGTLLDVGGNIGSITIPIAEHVGPTGTVHIFEPSPKFFSIIKKNIALNNFDDRATTHQVAVGSSVGTVFLNESVSDDTTNHIAASGTAVPQDTLDSFTSSIPHIDFLKIDVEGYELEVLKGAKETLQKTNTLYIEFITQQLKRAGAKPESVIAILNLYFHLFTKAQDETLIPFVFSPSETIHIDLIGIKRT